MSKIFISHSSQDEKLARNLMDMLQTQFNLRREDFFLTSDEELEVGGNWIEEIRKGVEEAKIILPIITPNFLESQFCLCELGAAWVNQKALVPIIVPPLNHSALHSTPYRTWVQVITLSTIKDLSRLAEAMIKRDVGHVNIVRFTTRSEGFYTETLEPYIKSLEQREPVTAETFNSINLELQEFKQAYTEVEKELSIAKKEIEQLRKMKNSEEIQAFDFARLDDWQTFTTSVENTKRELTPISNLVTSILFHARKHRSYNGFIGDSDDFPALRVEENKGFIKWDEGWVPDYEHPAILRANNAIEELFKVIETLEEDEVFRQKFNDVYKDIRLDLSFTPFWEEVLDQTIYHSSR